MGIQKLWWFGKLHSLVISGLRSREREGIWWHQYTCWLWFFFFLRWTHLLLLGVRRQEHFNVDFNICYKILSCPEFFHSPLQHEFSEFVPIWISPHLLYWSHCGIQIQTLFFLNICIFLPVKIFLSFKTFLYINDINFVYFFVADIIWEYVTCNNLEEICIKVVPLIIADNLGKHSWIHQKQKLPSCCMLAFFPLFLSHN